MDYALPRADGLPDIEVLSTVTPSPHHPLGVEGDRRGRHDRVDRARSTTPCSMRSSPFGVEAMQMPFTPERVWQRASRRREGSMRCTRAEFRLLPRAARLPTRVNLLRKHIPAPSCWPAATA